MGLALDWECDFHAAEEITLHPVRARGEHFRLAAILEIEGAGVLEEAPYDGSYPDVVRNAGNAGAKRTHAPHDQINFDPGAGRPIQTLNHLRLDQRIHFRDDAGSTARARVSSLPRKLRNHRV